MFMSHDHYSFNLSTNYSMTIGPNTALQSTVWAYKYNIWATQCRLLTDCPVLYLLYPFLLHLSRLILTTDLLDYIHNPLND